mmetsp:Transcript_28970/g.67089  ORF Transcript_28970/g.67089 Transcript_28970/m.67089 type:complete len:206 (-) Transcript_28970:88-705(-)
MVKGPRVLEQDGRKLQEPVKQGFDDVPKLLFDWQEAFLPVSLLHLEQASVKGPDDRSWMLETALRNARAMSFVHDLVFGLVGDFQGFPSHRLLLSKNNDIWSCGYDGSASLKNLANDLGEEVAVANEDVEEGAFQRPTERQEAFVSFPKRKPISVGDVEELQGLLLFLGGGITRALVLGFGRSSRRDQRQIQHVLLLGQSCVLSA